MSQNNYVVVISKGTHNVSSHEFVDADKAMAFYCFHDIGGNNPLLAKIMDKPDLTAGEKNWYAKKYTHGP